MSLSSQSEINETNSRKHIWYALVGRATLTAIAYPLEYVKVLIQLGHEPLPPRPTRRFFGKPALALPGAWEYIRYIKKVDGFTGLYRGLSARLCANFVSGAVYSEVNRKLPAVTDFEDEEDDDDITEEQRIINFAKRTCKEMTAKCIALTCSQPFHVITIRYMAQFVGRETTYDGILSSIAQIYKDEGILGLFSGLIPRLVGEILTIWFASSVAFVINAYIIQDRTLQGYVSATTMFLSSSVTYPFTLVGNVMAVSHSGLEVAAAPNMPAYVNWIDCWSHLSSVGQLKRGSSILWRYYQGPYVVDETGVAKPVKPVKTSGSLSHLD
ncbi:mitochondrial carrier homolog 2-like [Ornithodoros turicata]|uniref:mitochondrial carrier homolog 2-like n=1 Tax=Ornithodoros turicata TaxID=34597 RepID=UPI003139BA1C